MLVTAPPCTRKRKTAASTRPGRCPSSPDFLSCHRREGFDDEGEVSKPVRPQLDKVSPRHRPHPVRDGPSPTQWFSATSRYSAPLHRGSPGPASGPNTSSAAETTSRPSDSSTSSAGCSTSSSSVKFDSGSRYQKACPFDLTAEALSKGDRGSLLGFGEGELAGREAGEAEIASGAGRTASSPGFRWSAEVIARGRGS